MGLRDDSRDPIVVRDADPRLIENLTLVENVKQLEREREAMKIELEAWLGLKPHVEAWLKERDADRAAINDLNKGLGSDLGPWSIRELRQKHAAAIARAIGQEGAK